MASLRILFVRFSHLGDVLHALPVVHAVRRALPEATLAFATQESYAPLVGGLPGIERVVPFDRDGGWRAWVHFRRDVRAFGPTWAIDCQGNWKSGWATWLSGAGRRSGLARSQWRERGARRLCNDLVPEAEAGGPHAVDRQLALARHVVGGEPFPGVAAGFAGNGERFGLGLTAGELADGRARLGDAPRPVLLHLAKPGDPRSWPSVHFIALAQRLAEAGRRVFLLAGPDEASLAGELGALPRVPGLTVIAGGLELRALAALFAAAAEAGGQLVGCDSGPSHLAAAVGLPVVHLFGPQDPERTGPYPPAAHVHLTAGLELGCRPCLARSCGRPGGAVCLEELGVEEVFAALEA